MTATDSAPAARRRPATPAGVGAIAVVEILGDIDAALSALGVRPIEPGRVALRSLGGIDEGVVARVGASHALLMPHGGIGVIRALTEALDAVGVAEDRDPDPLAAHPEADDLAEALMLETLPRAQSPAAVDLLLDQPRRWRAWDGARPDLDEVDRVSCVLNRLIDPPLVVAVGPPNVGKSTLTNALAQRAVSVVADEAGTTRDHVGVSLVCPSPGGAVAILWVDAPGVGPDVRDGIEAEALRLARAVIARADLIVSCGDAASGFLDDAEIGAAPGAPMIRAGLRADLGPAPGADVSVAALHGRGVADLAAAVRRALVPDEALAWPGPWRFDRRLTGAGR
ncbi:MAG: hypothetical protein D6693_09450 [Planctomycetota bacterium]|nr:MAG: hypothetical protein D6693_09450 [Planctomycetota bacterium]